MSKLATEQATALLAADPFVIVRMWIDDEGDQDYDFEPITVATNALWNKKELDQFVKDCHPEYGSELRSCQAVYLCHLKLDQERYPNYGSFWDLIESELIATEPFAVDDGTAVEV